MKKKLVLSITGGISFVIFLILFFATSYLRGRQLSQTAAERWDSEGGASQISCFFSVNSRVTENTIIDFEHTIDSSLAEASVTLESENPGARLWADAYSADGKVSVSTDRANISVDAIGIGGDFFMFHPLALLYGSYFSGNDLVQDYCIIDEDAAWQLFGSSNVAGQMVNIGGRPHLISGVIRRDEGRLEKAAGLDSTVVYVSYETLTKYGRSNGINHYEIVMPNPISEFAYNLVLKGLGSDEKNTEVLENTSRYSFLSRLKLVGEFGTRSMNGKAIIYPYWENIARGYEDILALLTLLELVFLIYPIGLALVFFCIWWKHKGWTLKDVWHKLKDKAERQAEKIRAAGNNRDKKEKKEAKREKIGKKEKKEKRLKRRKKTDDLGYLDDPD